MSQTTPNFSPEYWEKIEREEHDRIYASLSPFDGNNQIISPERVLRWENYCYLEGARPDRGHRTRRLFDLVDIHNIKGLRILDVGCGIGQYSVFLALMGADVTGFDISPVGVESARQLARVNKVEERCRFDVANASAMPYADGAFDIVIFHEVLHHAIKYPNVREETLRVLKTGGKVVISETLRGNFLVSLGRRITMWGDEAKGDVILEEKDLTGFAKGFSAHRIEPMSLTFMVKRVFQSKVQNRAVRMLLRSCKNTDDLLLRLFPSLSRYCGECVMILQK